MGSVSPIYPFLEYLSMIGVIFSKFLPFLFNFNFQCHVNPLIYITVFHDFGLFNFSKCLWTFSVLLITRLIIIIIISIYFIIIIITIAMVLFFYTHNQYNYPNNYQIIDYSIKGCLFLFYYCYYYFYYYYYYFYHYFYYYHHLLCRQSSL